LPRVLDVGCGPRKYPGSIGIDMNRNTAADVICHLDRGALPFRDNAFDEVRAVHLIEHVENVIGTIEEFHRVTRSGGTIFLVTPHYTDFSSFCDPTHRWHLNSFSFWYFYPEGLHGEASWYSGARLRQRRLRVRLLQAWRYLGFEFLVNHSLRFRRFWEFYLCYLVRGKVMEFELEVLK
jgi:SAM-dependent methyltransferase